MLHNKANIVDKFGKPVGFDQTAAFTPQTPTFASVTAGRHGSESLAQPAQSITTVDAGVPQISQFAGETGDPPESTDPIDPTNDQGAQINEQRQGGLTLTEAKQLVQGAYEQFLGRSGSDSEILSQLTGGKFYAPVNVDFAIANIRNSVEARTFANRATTSDPPPSDSPPPPSDPPPKDPAPPSTPLSPTTPGQDVFTLEQFLEQIKTPVDPAPPGFTAGTIPTNPLPTFVPSTFSFNDGGVTDETRRIIGELLAEPSFSDDVINKLRERQKDTILALGESSRQQTIQRGATRGVSQGGRVGAQLSDIQDRQAQDITGAFRDIDITATLQNRKDKESAAGRADQFLNSLFGRQIGGAEFNADQAFRGFESERLSERDLIDRFLSQQELNETESQSALASFLAEQQAIQGSRSLDIEGFLGLGDLNLRQILGEAGINNDIIRIILGQ